MPSGHAEVGKLILQVYSPPAGARRRADVAAGVIPVIPAGRGARRTLFAIVGVVMMFALYLLGKGVLGFSRG